MTKRNFKTNPEQMLKAQGAREMNRYPRVKVKRPYMAGRIDKFSQVLPQQVVDNFNEATYEERNNYIHELTNAGWTKASIGRACNLSRESIRQIVAKTTHTVQTNFYVPEPPIHPYPTKVTYTLPPTEMLERMLELQPYAQKVRSSSPRYRAEAEEYSYLLNEAIEKHGVTVYRLAILLGITPSAIQFRLVRYGYRNSSGTSRSYNKIIEANKAVIEKKV